MWTLSEVFGFVRALSGILVLSTLLAIFVCFVGGSFLLALSSVARLISG